MHSTILKAGQSRVVVDRQFSSVPKDYHFSAESTSGTASPAGTVEISRRKMLSGEPAETRQLLAENTVSAGLWDTFLKVTVHAHEDITLTTGKRAPGTSKRPILLIVLAVAGIVAVALLMFLASA